MTVTVWWVHPSKSYIDYIWTVYLGEKGEQFIHHLANALPQVALILPLFGLHIHGLWTWSPWINRDTLGQQVRGTQHGHEESDRYHIVQASQKL